MKFLLWFREMHERLGERIIDALMVEGEEGQFEVALVARRNDHFPVQPYATDRFVETAVLVDQRMRALEEHNRKYTHTFINQSALLRYRPTMDVTGCHPFFVRRTLIPMPGMLLR